MRHIDADKLIDKIFPIGLVDDGKYTINAKAVKVAIDKMPTADVVPKSEVEKLKKENIELSLKNQLLYDEGKVWYDEYQKIKADLKQEKKYKRASEKLADKYCAELQTVFAELEAEYGEQSGADRGDDLTFGEIQDFLAKLKKKYTESEGNI